MYRNCLFQLVYEIRECRALKVVSRNGRKIQVHLGEVEIIKKEGVYVFSFTTIYCCKSNIWLSVLKQIK